MKKISAIVICFLLLLTCTLTGCAGFSVDRVKYYNEVVASVNGVNITRFELLNAYNSYGQNYFGQSESEEEIMASTLDLLIDRELLYQYVKSEKDALGNYKYKPTEYQVNEAVENIFNSLDDQMEEYVTDAKRALNIPVEDDDQGDDADTTAYKYEDYVYKKRADVVKVYYEDANFETESQTKTDYFQYKIKFKEEPNVNYKKLIDDAYLADFDNKDIYKEIRTKYLEHFDERLETEFLKNVKFETETEKQNTTRALKNKVLETLTKSLINYEYYLRDENGNKYSKDANELMDRYFERNFKSQIKSQYLTNFQNEYLKSYNYSLSELKEAFEQKIKSSYNKYNDDLDSYKSDLKNIGTGGDSILYHPDTAGTKFGYVIHTLFNFSDEQKSQLSELQTKYDEKSLQDYRDYVNEQVEENKLSQAEIETLHTNLSDYEKEYKKIVLSTEVIARDPATGLTIETDEKQTLKEFLTDFNGDYAKLRGNVSLQNFIQFMFKYTQDTATLSSGMPYVVGSYNEDAGETYSTNSAMEEAFTNESIKLMEIGKNSMSDYSDLDISNMCITSYGVHIVYYVDDVDAYDVNYFNYQNANFYTAEEESENNLFNKILNPLTGETYFDMLLDTVYPDSNGTPSNTGYSDYESNIIDSLQAKYKVTIYETKLKATKATIN